MNLCVLVTLWHFYICHKDTETQSATVRFYNLTMLRNLYIILFLQVFFGSLVDQNYVPEENNFKFKIKNAITIKAFAFQLNEE